MPHSSTLLVHTVTRRSEKTGDAVSALKSVFRENPLISSDVRAQTAQWALGIRVFQRRLRHLLQETEAADFDPRSPPSDVNGAIWHFETKILGTSPGDARKKMGATIEAAEQWENAAIKRVLPEDRIDRLAIEQSLPDWLARHFDTLFGADASRLMAVLNRAGPITFRSPSSGGGRRSLAAELHQEGITTRPGRISPHALIAAGRPNIRASAAYRSGRFEVQDEASQLVIAACAPTPKSRVWDVCAGRGGKTVGLALSSHSVLATDVDDKALQDLRARIRRVGLANVDVRRLTPTPPENPSPQESALEEFDVVLVDAPCSALGTLRRSPDRRWTIEPADIAHFAALQREILWKAAPRVTTWGCLVYATCTLAKEENENLIAAFLNAHPHFRPAPLSRAWGPRQSRRLGLSSSAHHVTLLPHVHGTDGFFIARLERAA